MAPEAPLMFWLSSMAPVSISLSELHVRLGGAATAALSAFIPSGRDRQSPPGSGRHSPAADTASTKLISAYPKPRRSSRIPVQTT